MFVNNKKKKWSYKEKKIVESITIQTNWAEKCLIGFVLSNEMLHKIKLEENILSVCWKK